MGDVQSGRKDDGFHREAVGAGNTRVEIENACVIWWSRRLRTRPVCYMMRYMRVKARADCAANAAQEQEITDMGELRRYRA